MAREIKVEGDVATTQLPNGVVSVDACNAHLLDEYYISFSRNRTTSFVTAHDKKTRRGVRLSRLIMQAPKGLFVDHISGNPLDNRKSNLRIVTPSENNRNRAKACCGSSRYKGVSKTKGGKWSSGIWLEGARKHLGTFVTEEGAARAYDDAARFHFGKFCAVNFPMEGEQSASRKKTVNFHSQPNSQKGQPHHES